MKKLAGIISGIFRRPIWRTGQAMRGRVHKISIIAGGEVSIVIRCGLDEPRARQLLQGTLIEFFETRDGIPPPAPSENVISYKGELLIPVTPRTGLLPLADGCTCSAGDGEPHASECGAIRAHRSPADICIAPQLAIVKSDGCTCGAPGGYPHEPDCGYWDMVAGENAYDRESAGYTYRATWEQLAPEQRQHWIDRALEKKKAAVPL